MRKALLAAVLLSIALTLSAEAQMQPLGNAYQVRAALGDIPSTAAAEPAGRWNVAQSLRVAHTEGAPTTVAFSLPATHAVSGWDCSCGTQEGTASVGGFQLTIPASHPTGEAWVNVTSGGLVGEAFGFSLDIPTLARPEDSAVVLFVPLGSHAEGPVAGSSPGLATDGRSTIVLFEGTASRPLPLSPWFAVIPGEAAAPVLDADDGGFGWMELGLGLLAGALVWAFLVRRGVVQRRSRRQVAGVAEHEALAAGEPQPILEGRKRALLAALKELETARMAQEMETADYDALKADFKRQAVAVMRALESAEGKS